MGAYSGRYTVEGDKVVHRVDVSWNEAWTGTDQVRFVKVEGDRLTITTAPGKNPITGAQTTWRSGVGTRVLSSRQAARPARTGLCRLGRGFAPAPLCRCP